MQSRARITGVLEKYPVGSSEIRTQAMHDEYAALADRLKRGGMVPGGAPAATAGVVRRAIDDVQALLDRGGPTNAVDRVHTSLHGHLQYLCDDAGIGYDKNNDSTTALLKKLRREHRQSKTSARVRRTSRRF